MYRELVIHHFTLYNSNVTTQAPTATFLYTRKLEIHPERIPNGHSFNILHMQGIPGEIKGPVLHRMR